MSIYEMHEKIRNSKYDFKKFRYLSQKRLKKWYVCK